MLVAQVTEQADRQVDQTLLRLAVRTANRSDEEFERAFVLALLERLDDFV